MTWTQRVITYNRFSENRYDATVWYVHFTPVEVGETVAIIRYFNGVAEDVQFGTVTEVVNAKRDEFMWDQNVRVSKDRNEYRLSVPGSYYRAAEAKQLADTIRKAVVIAEELNKSEGKRAIGRHFRG